MKKFIQLFLVALILLSCCFINTNICLAKDFSGSSAEIVVELNTGRILHEKMPMKKSIWLAQLRFSPQ